MTFVTFSCAAVGIVVRMKEGTCQIIVEKKKKETVGEQLLPPSKIVPSELKPFNGDTLSFTTTHDIPPRMFPLQSDKDECLLLQAKIDKWETPEEKAFLIHFRMILNGITRQINSSKWEVSENLYLVKSLFFIY